MPILSVGHSTHDWSSFKYILSRHEVGLVVDVRSYPRSRLSHFSKPELRSRLNNVGISYLHFGAELGGYSGGDAPDYAAMARSPHFLRGVDRVLDLASRTRLVMMCSEHEPLECHRCLLIGRHLVCLGERLEHILRDGTVEHHAATEDRLLEALGRTETDLLASREERLGQAYEKQARRIARGLRLPQIKAAQKSSRLDAYSR